MTNENIVLSTIVGKFDNTINLIKGILRNKDNINGDTIYRIFLTVLFLTWDKYFRIRDIF